MAEQIIVKTSVDTKEVEKHRKGYVEMKRQEQNSWQTWQYNLKSLIKSYWR